MLIILSRWPDAGHLAHAGGVAERGHALGSDRPPGRCQSRHQGVRRLAFSPDGRAWPSEQDLNSDLSKRERSSGTRPGPDTHLSPGRHRLLDAGLFARWPMAGDGRAPETRYAERRGDRPPNTDPRQPFSDQRPRRSRPTAGPLPPTRESRPGTRLRGASLVPSGLGASCVLTRWRPARRGHNYGRRDFELITDVTNKSPGVPLEASSASELPVVFSADGRTLAGGGIGLSPTLWDTSSGRKLGEFSGKTGLVASTCLFGRWPVAHLGGEDGGLRSWHFVHKSEPVAQIAGHKAEVWGLAYTPDGTTLISAADDHSIKLWESRRRNNASDPEGARRPGRIPRGQSRWEVLASGSFDMTVRLWDLADGQPRAVLQPHRSGRAVAFSPDRRAWPRPAPTRRSESGTSMAASRC